MSPRPVPADAPGAGHRDLVSLLESIGGPDGRLVHIRRTPPRPGRHGTWPQWADADLVRAWQNLGVSQPWLHQVQAAEALHRGRHTVIATGTGSGKSLAAWLPVLSDVLEAQSAQEARGSRGSLSAYTSRPTALYLAPTKALAADQVASLERVVGELEAAQRARGVPAGSVRTVRVGTCDGDAPLEQRDWVRAHADVVLTNPDFLHFSLLPGHERWVRLLRGLRYVIVDECHAYRGVLGAHVALVLRRLLRLARRLSPDSPGPTVLCASATAAQPDVTAARLIGVPPGEVACVTEDSAPTGPRTLVLWQPAEVDPWAAWERELALSAGAGWPEDHGQAEAGAASGMPTGSASGAASGSASGAATGLAAGTPTAPSAGQTRRAPAEPTAVPAEPAGEPAQPPAAAVARPASGPVPGRDEPWTEPRTLADTDDPAADTAQRRSAVVEASELLVDLLGAGARALVFVRSRRSAEIVAERTREVLSLAQPRLRDTVRAYRGGYLPEERRELERDLRRGRLRALATTNALELGIDVTGLDAVLIAGWPGTRISLGQQAGRAGRAGAAGLAVLIASDNPLDAYLVHHPEAVFVGPEATVFDPANPYVLAPHLCAAASESPVREDDLALFGLPDDSFLHELADRGALRHRPGGWFWNASLPGRPQDLTSLRGDGPPDVPVIDSATGTVIGTVDGARADQTVHPGAVYVHQGRSYLVDELGPDGALVTAKRALRYRTRAEEHSSVWIVAERERQEWADGVTWSLGSVEVTSRVTGFARLALPGMEIVSLHPLSMPEHVLPTAAVWWTVPRGLTEAAGLGPDRLPGSLHAAEHASIGMLPLLATCDRWDLGGLSIDLHPQTQAPTVFVHDAQAGGAGFAERAWQAGRAWLSATLDAVAGCPCTNGCPSCVQSPKCGNHNEPLDKEGAIILLRLLLAAAPSA